MFKHVVVFLAVCGGAAPTADAADKAVPEARKAPLDKTLAKLSGMIGGVWVNNDPKFKVEFRYEWAFDMTAVRGIGVIDKGGPNESKVESTLGWDPVKKSVYYLDVHGGDTVYHGTVT